MTAEVKRGWTLWKDLGYFFQELAYMVNKHRRRMVCEGGRRKSARVYGRKSIRSNRRQWREYLHEAQSIGYSDEVLEPNRKTQFHWFFYEDKDSFNPYRLRRIMLSRVGKPWDDMLSEIYNDFPLDKTYFSHRLREYLVKHMVDVTPIEVARLMDTGWRNHRGMPSMYVEDGILNSVFFQGRNKYYWGEENSTSKVSRAFSAFCNGRELGREGTLVFWYCRSYSTYYKRFIGYDVFGNFQPLSEEDMHRRYPNYTKWEDGHLWTKHTSKGMHKTSLTGKEKETFKRLNQEYIKISGDSLYSGMIDLSRGTSPMP